MMSIRKKGTRGLGRAPGRWLRVGGLVACAQMMIGRGWPIAHAQTMAEGGWSIAHAQTMAEGGWPIAHACAYAVVMAKRQKAHAGSA